MEEHKCDTCEANEKLLDIITQRMMWIEEVLMTMTDNKSMEFLNVSNDIKKTIKHEISNPQVLSLLNSERERLRKEIKNRHF